MNTLRKSIIGILSAAAMSQVLAASPSSSDKGATPNFNTPPWEVWCQKQWAQNIPCSYLTWSNAIGFVLPGTAATNPVGAYTSQAWGQTAAQVTAAFPANIAKNFANNANLNAQLTNIVPILARLSTELLALDHSGYTAQILESAAKKASAANLRLLQSAFGNTLMAPAMKYAPAAIQAQYNALPALAPFPLSANYYALKGTVSPFTNAESYIIDVLAETYTFGSDSVAVALQKTSLYAADVFGGGRLNVLYLTGKGSTPAAVPAAAGVQPAGLSGPGPVWGWATVIITIIQFVDPNAAQDLYNAAKNIPSDLQSAWNDLPNGFNIGPDGSIGGGYPPDAPDYPGDGTITDPCGDGTECF